MLTTDWKHWAYQTRRNVQSDLYVYERMYMNVCFGVRLEERKENNRIREKANKLRRFSILAISLSLTRFATVSLVFVHALMLAVHVSRIAIVFIVSH